ncbi:MAG: LysR family transcriptional regulator [Pseudonocardiales bacterium]|nr:MAG: LysR family transcriptional regulator [Pseudonocardiales bacterium]
MRVDPERLLVLLAVAEAGGVVAAGRRLHLAPSGVSQHIAALERETGLVLLDRSRRGGQRPAQLTAAGRRLVAHSMRLADVLADAGAEAHALSGQVDGAVSVAAFPTVISPLVVPALFSLRRTHPGIRPAVFELDEESALKALHAGDIDLVLVEDDALDPRAVTPGTAHRWLMEDHYRLALPIGWPVPATIADLAERPWVDGPPGSAVRRVLDRLRATTGLRLPGAHSCIEFPAALALVGAGLAAALIPELARGYAGPELVRISDLPGLGARSISAIHRCGRHDPTPVAWRRSWQHPRSAPHRSDAAPSAGTGCPAGSGARRGVMPRAVIAANTATTAHATQPAWNARWVAS